MEKKIIGGAKKRGKKEKKGWGGPMHIDTPLLKKEGTAGVGNNLVKAESSAAITKRGEKGEAGRMVVPRWRGLKEGVRGGNGTWLLEGSKSEGYKRGGGGKKPGNRRCAGDGLSQSRKTEKQLCTNPKGGGAKKP